VKNQEAKISEKMHVEHGLDIMLTEIEIQNMVGK